MEESISQENKLKFCRSEYSVSLKTDCIYCDEVSGKKSAKFNSVPLVRSTPALPFTNDLLELASFAGIPISKKLGTLMLNFLNEGVSPSSVKNILHRVLTNCETKRVPLKRIFRCYKFPSSEDDGYTDDYSVENDTNYDDSASGSYDDRYDNNESVNFASTSNDFPNSTASHYLNNNMLLANRIGIDPFAENDFSSKKSPYYKHLPITGGSVMEMEGKK